MTSIDLNNFTKNQSELILSLISQRESLYSQLGSAKEQYRAACELFGNASKQAGRADKLVCVMQAAIESLNEFSG